MPACFPTTTNWPSADQGRNRDRGKGLAHAARPEYDKLIDSQFADVKNTGGRHGGSITAAQFLQRFVDDTPWAHLDIAGTAMGAPKTEINHSWGSGYGVRLLEPAGLRNITKPKNSRK